MTDAPVVELAGLTKGYAGRIVVDGLDLSVQRGEILALLGPNGAGKTTTVETIEGYRSPDAGTVRVLGLDPWRDRSTIRGRTGIMLQRADLWNQARVGEVARLFAAFYRRPLPVDDLLARVGLDGLKGARYRGLSGGERQRLALALALVGRPELAILDEPTAALDVTARRLTWELLRELRAGGATILLTTHLLDEAEQLSDRVAVLDHGRLLALGPPAELRARAADGVGRRRLRLELAVPLEPSAMAELATLAPLRSVEDVGPATYDLTTDQPGRSLVQLAVWLEARGIEPLGITSGTPSLEEAFVRLTEGAPPAFEPTADQAGADGGAAVER